MELNERIETINRQLKDIFGIDTESSQPLFRVVWSEDQFEKRLMNTTPEGFQLLTPVMMEVPKYKQWIKERHVLERLVVVPNTNAEELTTKKSYEPLFVFQNACTEEYLPPRFDAAKFVIDTMYAALGKKSMAKYVDSEAKNPIEESEKRVNKLQEELFGDESGLLGRTITGETVVVPKTFIGSKES